MPLFLYRVLLLLPVGTSEPGPLGSLEQSEGSEVVGVLFHTSPISASSYPTRTGTEPRSSPPPTPAVPPALRPRPPAPPNIFHTAVSIFGGPISPTQCGSACATFNACLLLGAEKLLK